MTRFLSSRLSARTSRRSAFPLITALALAAAAGSCDKVDSAQTTLDASNVKLESMASAGSNVVSSVKWRKEEFTKLASNLKPIADGGEGTQADAANTLLARSKGGLGEIAAQDAGEEEQKFLSQVTIARAQLNQWISQHSTAASLRSYDPAKDLAELDKQAADKFAEAAKYQADKAKQEAVVAEINARAEKARQAAKTERDREAGIRKQAEGMSQTAREQIITQAVEASRAADALERQASELSAEAAREAPKVDEIANIVDRLQKQVASLKQAKESIQARAAKSHEHSEQAAGEANAVGAKIKSTLDGLAAIRTAAASPTAEALKNYKEAVAASKKAAQTPAREGKVAAIAAQAGYQQCIGDVQATKARGLAVYASTLNALAQATPAVPGAEGYASTAKTVEAEFKTASDDAEAAYLEAKTNYESASKAGASADLKPRLEAVVNSLKLLHELRTKPADPAKPEDAKPGDAKPEGEKAADGKPIGEKPAADVAAISPEDAKVVEGEVRAAMKAMGEAVSDPAKALGFIDINNDGEKQAVEAMLPVGAAFAAMDAAATTKFGKSVTMLISESNAPAVKGSMVLPMLGMLGGSGLGSLGAASETAEITPVSKTRADISMPGAPAPARLVKKDGTWKLMGLGAALSGPMGGMIVPMAKPLQDAFTAVAASTSEGKYADADAMLTDLAAKVSPKPKAGAPKPGNGAGKPNPGGG